MRLKCLARATVFRSSYAIAAITIVDADLNTASQIIFINTEIWHFHRCPFIRRDLHKARGNGCMLHRRTLGTSLCLHPLDRPPNHCLRTFHNLDTPSEYRGNVRTRNLDAGRSVDFSPLLSLV